MGFYRLNGEYVSAKEAYSAEIRYHQAMIEKIKEAAEAHDLEFPVQKMDVRPTTKR